ncbi:MAG: SMP-30/gluconolactonase/LRE family protein [Bryobacteraceae bacterium]
MNNRLRRAAISAIIGVTMTTASLSAEELYVAKPFTAEGSFTPEIEGPAVDRAGNIYAVSFARKPTIGRITPAGVGEVFIEFTNGSLANGIRFDRAGIMYVADYTRHNVLRIDPKTRAVSVYGHSDEMHQPNDVAITADGIVFASDPDWDHGTGQVWKIGHDQKLVRIAENMGTANGIEPSPDGKKLYVNETVQRKVWSFTLHPDGSISNKTLLIEFPDFGLDGMRCDIDGNLYIARFGKGTVVKVSPRGEVLQEVNVLGSNPTNVCFGGPDGRTCYVTESARGRLLQFRVEKPGVEWQRWHQGH